MVQSDLRKLADLIRSGMPILQAVQQMAKEGNYETQSAFAHTLKEKWEPEFKLSDMLAASSAQNKWTAPIATDLIRAGESCDQLPGLLGSYADFLDFCILSEERSIMFAAMGWLLEETDLPISRVMQDTAALVGPESAEALKRAVEKIEQGDSFTECLKLRNLWGHKVMEKVREGEATGTLDKVFLELARDPNV